MRTLDYAAIALVMVASVCVEDLLSPSAQRFYADDRDLSYPNLPSVIPTWLSIVISVVTPVAAMLAALRMRGRKEETDATLTLFGMNITLTMIITIGLKTTVGRPRPHMLARCELGEKVLRATTTLFSMQDCMQPHRLHDAFRSFPSGHSSLAFSGLGFLALFAAKEAGLMHSPLHVYKVFLAMAPLLLAGFIAASRVSDYHHHPTDVLFGSGVGLLTAGYSWYMLQREMAGPQVVNQLDEESM